MFDMDMDASQWRTADAINSAMLRVYNYMLLAVLTSGAVAGAVASSVPLMQFLFTGWMAYVVIFLPLLAVIAMSIALNAEPPRGVALAML